MERLVVGCSPVASAQCLTGKGKAVHHIGEEQIKLQQQRIDGQDGCSLPGSYGGEVEVDGHQEKRTQEDVPVNTQESDERCQTATCRRFSI